MIAGQRTRVSLQGEGGAAVLTVPSIYSELGRQFADPRYTKSAGYACASAGFDAHAIKPVDLNAGGCYPLQRTDRFC